MSNTKSANAGGVTEQPKLTDALDAIHKCSSFNNLIWLAATGLFHCGGEEDDAVAFQTAADIMDKMLDDATRIVDAAISGTQKGGAK